jgi:hypothetical protein
MFIIEDMDKEFKDEVDRILQRGIATINELMSQYGLKVGTKNIITKKWPFWIWINVPLLP